MDCITIRLSHLYSAALNVAVAYPIFCEINAAHKELIDNYRAG